MLVKTKNFSDAMLRRFQDYQRLSFEILEETASNLTEGVTERQVARELVKRYREQGVESFFHLPVVLFGKRTALPGQWSIGKFFPRDNGLRRDDSVILDAAPLFQGYLVDTSYSFCFGSSAAHRSMMQHLSTYREHVCEAVNRGDSFRQIALDVNASLSRAGYEPVHGKHPGAVLGHRAVKTPRVPGAMRLQGFDAISLSWFRLTDGLASMRLANRSPLWNTSKSSDHKPHDGLWLVEPHAGAEEGGAKWEEILVIERGQARWLDDRPPHVRQWQQIKSRQAYRPQSVEQSA